MDRSTSHSAFTSDTFSITMPWGAELRYPVRCAMSRAFALPLLVTAFAWPALAANAPPIFLWVAPTGNDTNSCLSAAAPCGTIQGAIDKVPYGTRGIVNLLPGHYPGGVNIVGYLHNFIGIYGPYDSNVQCVDPAQVVIDAPGAVAFWIQDHASTQFGCLSISAASVGFSGRQFSIIDFSDIVFGQVGVSISATDRTMASCTGGVWVTGSGFYFATAYRSDLNIGCNIKIAAGVTFVAFFGAFRQSTIETASATFSGNIFGQKWYISNSEIGPTCSVPGTGVTQTNFAVAPLGC